MPHARLPRLLSASALILLVASLDAAPGWTRSDPEMCHTLVDGRGAPVVNAGDRRVLTVGSEPCPQPAPAPQVVARAPAPAPPPPPAPVAGPIFTLAGDLAFDSGRARIKPEFYPLLDEIAAKLRQSPGLRVALTGHTDAEGAEAYNRDLSVRRARAVADYLQQTGVAPSRLVVRGAGESRPIATNETAAGRARNRRVEIGAI